MRGNKRYLIITSVVVIISLVIFNWEDFYLEYVKHNLSTKELKYSYFVKDDSLSFIYGIYTIKDKSSLLKLTNGELKQINSDDWHEIPFISKSDCNKVEVIKYLPDSDLAIVRFYRLNTPKMDPIEVIYMPLIYLHDTLPRGCN